MLVYGCNEPTHCGVEICNRATLSRSFNSLQQSFPETLQKQRVSELQVRLSLASIRLGRELDAERIPGRPRRDPDESIFTTSRAVNPRAERLRSDGRRCISPTA